MAPRPLDELLARQVHLGRVAVHTAQELAFQHVGHGGGAGVAMGRRRAAGRVVHLQTHDGLAGGVGELVVVQDLELLPGTGVAVFLFRSR